MHVSDIVRGLHNVCQDLSILRWSYTTFLCCITMAVQMDAPIASKGRLGQRLLLLDSHIGSWIVTLELSMLVAEVLWLAVCSALVQ